MCFWYHDQWWVKMLTENKTTLFNKESFIEIQIIALKYNKTTRQIIFQQKIYHFNKIQLNMILQQKASHIMSYHCVIIKL